MKNKCPLNAYHLLRNNWVLKQRIAINDRTYKYITLFLMKSYTL